MFLVFSGFVSSVGHCCTPTDHQEPARDLVLSTMQYDGGNNARGYEDFPVMDGKPKSRGFSATSSSPHQRFDMQPKHTTVIELEHTIGFSAVPNAIHYHPSGREYVYPAGGSVLLTSFQDAHSQDRKSVV